MHFAQFAYVYVHRGIRYKLTKWSKGDEHYNKCNKEKEKPPKNAITQSGKPKGSLFKGLVIINTEAVFVLELDKYRFSLHLHGSLLYYPQI